MLFDFQGLILQQTFQIVDLFLENELFLDPPSDILYELLLGLEVPEFSIENFGRWTETRLIIELQLLFVIFQFLGQNRLLNCDCVLLLNILKPLVHFLDSLGLFFGESD